MHLISRLATAILTLSPLVSAADIPLCGTGNPSSQLINHVTRNLPFEDSRLQNDNNDQILRRANGTTLPPSQWANPIKVNVHLHAAVPTVNATLDYMSEATLQKQFDVLQAAYAPHDIQLTLANITRTIQDNITSYEVTEDETSAVIGTPNAAIEAWWRQMRTGDYTTLHIFVYDSMPYMGQSNFPAVFRPVDHGWLDAVHLNAAGLPGGSRADYSLGRTAVHEVGHWFGLFHPFGGQCDDETTGDFVADTPRQKDYTGAPGCPEGKDTCPDVPGLDNIHNYMDYSADSCKILFTEGQVVRMHTVFNSVRVANW